MLTIDTIPLQQKMNAGRGMMNCLSFIIHRSYFIIYLVSLWPVWRRQRRQNLLNSSRSGVVFLFFVVT